MSLQDENNVEIAVYHFGDVTWDEYTILVADFDTVIKRCTIDAQCDDGKICTIDRCLAEQCTHEFISTQCRDAIQNPLPRGALLETFYGIAGGAVLDLTNDPKYTNNKPDERVIIQDSLEAPVNRADNFGARLSTYIYAPASGNYNLYVSSDDASVLFLSTDANPANKEEIASVSWFTDKDDFTAYSSQKSDLIYLEVGRAYYLEALHKEGGGGDHLSIAWKSDETGLELTKIQEPYFFLEPWVACSSDSQCRNSNPCIQSSCNSETKSCEDTPLCENEKVNCGGQKFAPSCDKCPGFSLGCMGECTWSNGSCMNTAILNCGAGIRPQKEFAEGCVTKVEEDLNNCRKVDRFRVTPFPDPNAYDTIKLGERYVVNCQPILMKVESSETTKTVFV